MSQSLYSYNGSRVTFLLEDKIAEAYNRAMDAFMDAQGEYMKENGLTQMTPEALKHIRIRVTIEEHMAYNAVTDLINHLSKVNGGHLEITNDDMTSDHLVKI